jgi:hypothetical protein
MNASDKRAATGLSIARGRAMKRSATSLGAWAAVVAAACSAGCASKPTTFVITDHRAPGETHRYRETFPEGFFAVDEHGNVDIVLRRESRAPQSPHEPIVQVVHIRTVWKSVPGQTVAHATQINGTVSYFILTGRVGATFEGAGSVFFELDDNRLTLSGELEQASLRPRRILTASNELFLKAELSGQFTANQDPRRAYRIIHEVNRRFDSARPPR